MQRILNSRTWTDVQRKWLKRIEDQILREMVVDRDALDEEPFTKDGGVPEAEQDFWRTD